VLGRENNWENPFGDGKAGERIVKSLESAVYSREPRIMTKIERFEDVKAWQKARELVKSIYQVTSEGGFAKDYSLKDQLRRASISVMSNIAEGFSRQTDREFAQFLHVAKGSASEVQSQLYVALDLKYISEATFKELYELSEETIRLISGFVRYLKGG
jgi:four helix bundle protein